MDGLSAAASGIAVASVALQLAGNVKQLCEFWKSIKEAPEDIHGILVDLELLSTVLTQLAHEAQRAQLGKTIRLALNGCWAKIESLTTILNEIRPGFASERSGIRKWSAFKAVMKRGQLVKLREALEEAKSTLMLVIVQQVQSRLVTVDIFVMGELSVYLDCKDNTDHMTRLFSHFIPDAYTRIDPRPKSMIQGVPILETEEAPCIAKAMSGSVSGYSYDCAAFQIEGLDISIANTEVSPFSQVTLPTYDGNWRHQVWFGHTWRQKRSVMNFSLFTICTESKIKERSLGEAGNSPYDYNSDHFESETSYTISPAPWLIRLGLQYGLRHRWLSSSSQGWNYSLETIRPVADNALIFDFCRSGNLPAVQKLLSSGHASVRDTDSWGYTPLHYAAQSCHPELCRLLRVAGADPSVLTHEAETAMELAAGTSYATTYPELARVLDTLRLLADSMDFSDEAGNGWKILMTLCFGVLHRRGEQGAKVALLLWMFKLSRFEMKIYVFIRRHALLLSITSYISNHELEEAHDLLVETGGKRIIDEPTRETEGFTILHVDAIYISMYDISLKRCCFVILKGADLYPLGFSGRDTPAWETPTSLAMYSQWTFENLQDALRSNKIDLDQYVQEELTRNKIVHPGWTKQTLLYLLAHNHEPTSCLANYRCCSDCDKGIRRVYVQPYWRYRLERIKRGLYIDMAAQSGDEANAIKYTEYTDFENITNILGSLDEETCGIEDDGVDCLSEPSFGSDLEPESETELQADPHEYPRSASLVDCVYAPVETVCMDCWLHYVRTGTHRQPGTSWKRRYARTETSSAVTSEDESSEDEASEDEFSPYLIHT